MNKDKHSKQTDFHVDEIDLHELFHVLSSQKYLIITLTLIISIISIIYVLNVPNRYTSQVILAPAQDQSESLTNLRGSDIAGRGLVSIAGIGLGEGRATLTKSAIHVMRSWGFIEEFINTNNLAVELIAVKGWDESSNELIIKDRKYDAEQGKWLGSTPTSWELYEEFSKRFSVYHDEREGFINVSIDYYSPTVAKNWVNLMVSSINDHMRHRSLDNNNLNIQYLEEQIQKTSITEMREIFYKLIEEETRSKMLAEATPEYAFVIVSKAMVPEQRSFPKRKVLVTAITFVGGLLTIFLVLIAHYIGIANKKIK